MSSIDRLVAELRAFDGRREVVQQLRREIRKPLPAVRKAVARSATTRLPGRGGLGKWAAKTRVTAVVAVSGRTAGVRVKGARQSLRGASDIRALDRGRVRHPSWGRRRPGQWHVQLVRPQFFTDPVGDAKVWQAACVAAVDHALDTIRG